MKVLVIGSGPIVIGQAAEFDYAGTQACKSLKEEGHEVVLINSNPATIMTDPGVADALYIEPLNTDFCERVIAREKPDALLPTLGGQTGLNLATQLHDEGILEKYNVKLLGTPLSAIRKAEDREQFRALMHEIKEPVPESWIIETPEQLEAILDVVPYPCIIRPAYTLGGTGGGIANTREELWETGQKGLKLSMRSQIMVERSLLGWKEIEYEVMRDSAGNCITVCNMENFDPMGVHTGDSIVVAPSQTMSDIEYHMMRTASLKIINALGIEGGCNVQMSLNPDSFDYYIIEVNPRVSRSSALASKATGYPIARVAAKIAVGLTLDQIDNQVTGTTKACFEPALDYIVVKIPRWPFDKFASGDRTLFTQMKATGEVMAIDRTFESAFMKAIRGLEVKQKDLRHPKFQEMEDEPLAFAIQKPTDERLWAIAEGLRRGWGVERVNKLSRVDKWFLRKIESLLLIERELVAAGPFGTWDDQLGWEIEGWARNIHLGRIPEMTREELLAVAKATDSKVCSETERRWAAITLLRQGVQPKDIAGENLPLEVLNRIVKIREAWAHRQREGLPVDISPDNVLRSQLIRDAFLIGFPSGSILSLMGITPEGGRLAKSLSDEIAQESNNWNDPNDDHEIFEVLAGTFLDWDFEDTALRERYVAMHRNFTTKLEETHVALGSPKIDRLSEIPIHQIAFLVEEVERQKVMPVFKMVDTCAGEFESQTPYYYGTFEQEDDALMMSK